MNTLYNDFYHNFHDTFGKYPGELKYEGIDLLNRVKAWAKKWPGRAHLVHCDDSTASGSYILLLEDDGGNRLWGGIRAYVLPQYGKSTRFDMYREEIEAAVKTFQDILDRNPRNALELQHKYEDEICNAD